MKKTYDWTVIGAGPAGIAAVGQLLEQGADPNTLLWIDPDFTVGDFGRYWGAVSSNTRVGLFHRFLEQCKYFDYRRTDYPLNCFDDAVNCPLHEVMAPLQHATDHMRQHIDSHIGFVKTLALSNQHWQIHLASDPAASSNTISSKRVILATGADPKTLQHTGYTPKIITLQQALNPSELNNICKPHNTIAVFGSSHSAMMIIRELLNIPNINVYNFYLSPLRYALYLEDWILFDDSGLKGETARWSREHIDGTWPSGLKRFYANDENLTHYLPACQKAIYAVGFQPRHAPHFQDQSPMHYNPHNGIIAPGLFGRGIGFPENKRDRYDFVEHRVGLWKFMDYLQRIIPLWKQY